MDNNNKSFPILFYLSLLRAQVDNPIIFFGTPFPLHKWRAESSVAAIAHLREKRGQQTRVCALRRAILCFGACDLRLRCAHSDRGIRRRSLPTVDPHLWCDSVSASCETESIMGSNYKLDKDAFSRRLKRLYDLWKVRVGAAPLCLLFSPADTARSRRRRSPH
jgi:hypothetical protein